MHYQNMVQKSVTLGSTEAEYLVLSEASKVVVWLKQIMNKPVISQESTVVLHDDAEVVTAATDHPAEDFGWSKHAELPYHHVREKVQNGGIRIENVSTFNMDANLLTKMLNGEQFEKRTGGVQIVNNDQSGDEN